MFLFIKGPRWYLMWLPEIFVVYGLIPSVTGFKLWWILQNTRWILTAYWGLYRVTHVVDENLPLT